MLLEDCKKQPGYIAKLKMKEKEAKREEVEKFNLRLEEAEKKEVKRKKEFEKKLSNKKKRPYAKRKKNKPFQV